jgi:hypothetical protein
MPDQKPPLPDQGRLSKATGRLKQAVDEAVQATQRRHPQATREDILSELESWGFDETDWYPPHLRGVTWDKPSPTSPPPNPTPSTKR